MRISTHLTSSIAVVTTLVMVDAARATRAPGVAGQKQTAALT